MSITGTTISRAGDRTARLEGAAIRDERRKQALQHEAERQAHYRRQQLAGQIPFAEAEVSRLKRELADLESDLAEAEATMRETGRRPAKLSALRVTAADFPDMIAAAEQRVQAARGALAAAQPAEVAPDTVEPEPVADAPRGRGRPPKGGH